MANAILKVCEVPRTKGALYTVESNKSSEIYGISLINNQTLSGSSVNLYVAGAGTTAASTPETSGIFRVLADNFTGYAQVNKPNNLSGEPATSSYIMKEFPVAIKLGAGDMLVGSSLLTGVSVMIYGKEVRAD